MKRAEGLELIEARKIFGDWQETILWSCLDEVMGEVFVPDDVPEGAVAAEGAEYREGAGAAAGTDTLEGAVIQASAAAWLGDFCLLGGRPNAGFVRDICARMKKIGQRFLIMVPQDEVWADCIAETQETKAKPVMRYAIKKEPDVFDTEKLNQAVAAAPEGTELRLIGEQEYNTCLEEPWSRDLVGNYKDFETFQRLGLGIVAICDGKIVSGASSYSSYNGGIEIEIDTKSEYRRKGFAYACGAKLILECLSRGWYPSWDAQNLSSVALAEKLGYHFDCEYLAYEVSV